MESVVENPDTYEEQNMFEKSPNVQLLLQNVNDRLGFTPSEEGNESEEDNQLSFEDMKLVYDMCRYEAAWHPQNISYWCAAFNDDDLKVLLFFIICREY